MNSDTPAPAAKSLLLQAGRSYLLLGVVILLCLLVTGVTGIMIQQNIGLREEASLLRQDLHSATQHAAAGHLVLAEHEAGGPMMDADEYAGHMVMADDVMKSAADRFGVLAADFEYAALARDAAVSLRTTLFALTEIDVRRIEAWRQERMAHDTAPPLPSLGLAVAVDNLKSVDRGLRGTLKQLDPRGGGTATSFAESQPTDISYFRASNELAHLNREVLRFAADRNSGYRSVLELELSETVAELVALQESHGVVSLATMVAQYEYAQRSLIDVASRLKETSLASDGDALDEIFNPLYDMLLSHIADLDLLLQLEIDTIANRNMLYARVAMALLLTLGLLGSSMAGYYYVGLRRNLFVPLASLTRTIDALASGRNPHIERQVPSRYHEVERLQQAARHVNEVRVETQRLALEHQQLIGLVRAPVIGFDEDGRVTFWNRMAEELTDRPSERVLGSNLDWGLEAAERATLSAAFDRLRTSTESEELVIRLQARDGQTVVLQLVLSRVQDQLAGATGILATGLDITDKLEKDAALVQASKLSSLGEMAAGIAHELNQPMHVIRFAITNLQRRIEHEFDLDPSQQEVVEEKLGRVQKQIDRATTIIDHLRMFGRKVDPREVDRIDVRRCIDSTLDLIGEQMRLSEVTVVVEAADDVPPVDGHQILIEQVLLNLMTNARDAMHGLTHEKRIMIGLDHAADRVLLTVEDNGTGIDPHVAERIFEPFYTTKEVGSGTGLGLSVSFGIVRDMGGAISVANTDRGARFTIDLPVATGVAGGIAVMDANEP